MNSVHPTAIITGDVEMGAGNTIGAFVLICGPVSIGNDNWIGTGTVIGAPPEVRSFDHAAGRPHPATGGGVAIGDRNVIREYVQVHQGWKGTTTIGDDTFIMNQCYVAHDCHILNAVTLASSVLLAGHVAIGAGANLGLGTSVHQFRCVGAGSMVGMGSVITKDVPPFAKSYGNPATTRGVNSVGMSRQGIDADSVAVLARAYESGDFSQTGLSAALALATLAPVLDAWFVRDRH